MKVVALASMLLVACATDGIPRAERAKFSLLLHHSPIALVRMPLHASVIQTSGPAECAVIRWELYAGGEFFAASTHEPDCVPGEMSDRSHYEPGNLGQGLWSVVAHIYVRGQLVQRLWRDLEVR